MSSECGGSHAKSAKVEAQARLLARTLDDMALEPDGEATASGTARRVVGGYKWVQLPPALLTIQLPGSDYILIR